MTTTAVDGVPGVLARPGGTPAVLEQLTDLGAQLFGPDRAVPCGLMFRRQGEQALFLSVSPVVLALYAALNAQHAADAGPAPLALEALGPQVADDTSDPTYPPFFAVTAAVGFLSILSIPLALDGGDRAALNFYARPAAFFTPERQHIAAVFAEQAGATARTHIRLNASEKLTDDLQAAMRSRTGIDIAIGIIVAQNRCSQDEAFGILKRASMARNIKLKDLAAGIITQAGGAGTRTHFGT
ncbi:GAF and ANTAR domain-containing protein [Arthrobacter sp. Leaf234]|uniref:GAF and ANTAR domain-containing protein n=1 Tax=Arthrobacter sp. Leaf234 TaxID=1736303 RepID=UPI00138F320E|nr:GAF and ANTAR domain-containing protein [Arthrobacter sp. Leaf234]